MLVEEDGAIVGRVNLVEAAGGSAELGFRIAERAARVGNAGSRTVLIRTGFVPTGEVALSGRPGIRYRLELT